jgi:hypothetical protein
MHLNTFFFIKSSHPIKPPTNELKPTNKEKPMPIVAPIAAPAVCASLCAVDITSFVAAPVEKNMIAAIKTPKTEGNTIIYPRNLIKPENFAILVASIDFSLLQAPQSNLICSKAFPPAL